MNEAVNQRRAQKSLLRSFGEVQATTGFYAKARLPYPVENPGGTTPRVTSCRGSWRCWSRSPRMAKSVSRPPSARTEVQTTTSRSWSFPRMSSGSSRRSAGADPSKPRRARLPVRNGPGQSLRGVRGLSVADGPRAAPRRFPALLSAKAKRELERGERRRRISTRSST